jgi:CRP/FNR family transcriptional regulator, cyclic AMP receptor protein
MMLPQEISMHATSLGKVAAFKELSPQALDRIGRRCAWRRYQPGEIIVSHLDQSDDVFFAIAGQARVSLYSAHGHAIDFCDLGSGDMFGEVAAIDGAPRSASVEARTECLIASISAAAFGEALRNEPMLTEALIRYLATKVRELTTRVYEFSALPVRNRIHAELLRLTRLSARQGRSATIAAMPTHAEIASRTSTHREAVSRELSRLARNNVIERRGRSLVVKDVDRLAAMVHEVS